jgi:molecular chaperone DnaJ
VTTAKADYYELLGVPRDSDGEGLRRAFWAAARECHPDVNDSPAAQRRFRELAEAYDVLSKPDSRLLYDKYGYRGRGNSGFDDERWDSRERIPRGEDVHREIVLRAYEATHGGSRVVAYEAAQTCPSCEGRGTSAEPDPACPKCGGPGRRRQVSDSDVRRLLHIDTCPACSPEVCVECGGSGRVYVARRLRVRVPPGVQDGEQLRVGGEGSVGQRGGIPGDLLLAVEVLPEPTDPRLVRYMSLALFAAALVTLFFYLH